LSLEFSNGRLQGDLTLEGVPQLLARLGNGAAVRGDLDLAGITRADSAGVALLLELKRRARAAGTEVVFRNAPPQLAHLADFFRLNPVLHLDSR
jgi:phospholipid transport system transporter-binding protein